MAVEVKHSTLVTHMRKLAMMAKVNRVTCYLRFEQAEAVRKLALSKGCVVERGPYAGQGSISKLLQGIAEGKLTVVRLGQSNEQTG